MNFDSPSESNSRQQTPFINDNIARNKYDHNDINNSNNINTNNNNNNNNNDNDYIRKKSLMNKEIVIDWPLLSRSAFTECLMCYAVDMELGPTVSTDSIEYNFLSFPFLFFSFLFFLLFYCNTCFITYTFLTFQPVFLCFCLSVCLSVCLFVFLSTSTSIFHSTFLFLFFVLNQLIPLHRKNAS